MPVAVLQPAIARPPRSHARAAPCASVTVLHAACATCHLWELCPPHTPPAVDAPLHAQVIHARRRLATGDTLYHEGDELRFIHAVHFGSLKSTMGLRNGREQISGFSFSGDVMALDGIASGRHASTATAIEDTQVCAIAYSSLSGPLAHDRAVQGGIHRLMSRDIARAHRLLLLLGRMTAQERLAAFLLDLSHRFLARGRSACEFNLRMTRSEIGSYLGLTLETVSRTLSMFQQQGLLEVNKRRIRFADLDDFAGRYEALLET